MTVSFNSTVPSLRSLKAGLCVGLLVSLSACSAAEETSSVAPEPASAEVPSSDPVAATTVETVEVEEVSASDIPAEETGDEVRQVGSHVHGAANLAMALDGNVLSVELETPLHNLLGFEHAPETDAQTTTVETTESLLADPGARFTFTPEAGCVADPVEPINLFSDVDHSHDDHDHGHDEEHDHSHDDHDPDEGHDHGHDHEGEEHHHDEEHDHADGSEHAHKDAVISYSFQCTEPEQLRWMETDLFASFSNMTDIDLVYLGPSAQMSDTLTQASGRIELD